MGTVDEKGAAEFLGVSRSYLRQSRSRRSQRPSAIEGPAYLKYGRAVRYDMDDLITWKNAHRVTTVAQ